MISHSNTDRQLHAQDRLADRGIGLDFEAPVRTVNMADRELSNTDQLGASMFVEMYKNNPQLRAALENNIAEEVDMNVSLPGQVSFGVSPQAIERVNGQNRQVSKSNDLSM